MTDSLVFFSTAVLILVIGFLGHLFFKRTGWPETLFLIGTGIVLGPMLHVFAKEELLPALPLFSTFTLIMILFQSGMGLNLFEVVVGSGRIVLQTTAYFLVGMMAIALFLWLGVGWDWLDGLLMGSIVAQTGAVVIVPLASKLNVSPQAAVLLSLEATLTSIYNIVFFFVFLEARIGEVVNLWDAASFILIKYLIGIGIGVMLGVAFLRLFVSFEEEKLTYLMLISFLLSAYVVSEYLGGSGALAVLVFGTVLGNDSEYLRVFRIHSDTLLYAGVYSYLNRLQSEISHILRTFFLVLLGLLLDPSPGNLVLGVSMGVPIIFMLLIIRYGVTFVSTWKSPMEADRLTITGMCALGLTPALLSFIPLQYGLQGASRYTLIVTNIIIMTNIITSVVTLLNKRSNGA